MQENVLEKSFDEPDLQWKLDSACTDVVRFDGFTALRTTFFPGMLYSRDIRPHIPAAQERFPTRVVYCQSGVMHQKQHSGTVVEYRPGGVYQVHPWEDGFEESWVLGDEPCVLITVIPSSIPSQAASSDDGKAGPAG